MKVKKKKTSVPKISVILPVLNGARALEKCLTSLKKQSYPFSKLEILVVDDDSSDNTVAVAKKYGSQILRNGSRHIEKGKAIGLKAAKHELVLFLDADNYLPARTWLANAVEALLEDEKTVGVESSVFHYCPEDPAANRYCSLMGINDPMAFYLNKRDRLTAWEHTWCLLGEELEDKGKYWKVRFKPEAVPTIGSQGFLARKSVLKKATHWPCFFHIDANVELIAMGYDRYALLKQSIGHDHCLTSSAFLKKCRRNLDLFFKYRHLRKFTWKTSRVSFFLALFSMLTLVRPMWHAWQRRYSR